MMRETVPDEAQLAFLDVLLDRIIRLVFANFLLRIRPARDFNNHVENLRRGGRGRSEQGDIMPRGDDDTISLLKEDAMFERIWRACKVSLCFSRMFKGLVMGMIAEQTYVASLEARHLTD